MLSPLWLSLIVSMVALLVVVPVGGGLGYGLARRRGILWSIADALVLLPLVMPPTVVGYGMLLLWGRHGWFGAALEQVFGLTIAFTPVAATACAAVVALPLMAKTAQVAFARVDRAAEEMALVDGASPVRVFFSVSLPLALPGIAVGTLLAFARGLGELGATMIFAGNIPGRTTTLPLAIVLAHEAGDTATAERLSALLAAIALCIALVLQRLTRRTD